MIKKKLSVYRYHDYRRYFADLITANSESGITLRKLSSLLEISPSYLSQVISGKKDFSADILLKFKKVIRLDKNEMKHLSELLNLSRSDEQKLKLEVFDKIMKDKKYKKENPNEHEAYSYLSQWYFVALKEYFMIHKEVPSYDRLKDEFYFKLKNSEIKKALKFLIGENFIEVDKNSNVTVKKDQVDCYSDIYRLSLSHFHKQMFNLAIESIHLVDRSERLILGNTIGISDASHDKVKAVIQKAHEEIRQIEIDDIKTSKNRVYQISLVTFPLMKKRGLK